MFAHHSRLSRGIMGDQDGLDALWRALFDIDGSPRVAVAIAGHDHNVSVYGPRARDNPKGNAIAQEDGTFLIVNGAGGDGFFAPTVGTPADVFNDDTNYYITRIDLKSSTKAIVDQLAVGPDGTSPPKADVSARIRIDLLNE